MKIAYVARWHIQRESGVLKKIRDQIRAWMDRGHDVRLFVLGTSAGVWSGLQGIDVCAVSAIGMLERERRARELVRDILAWAPDVVYLRFSTHFFAFEPLFRALPVIVEVNTDDIAEYTAYLPWTKYLLHRATRNRTLGRAAGIVCVTHELAARFRAFAPATAVISNGIDLSAYDALPPAANASVRAVFVGSPDQPWHGVEKIIRLAQLLPDWNFELVGPTLREAPPNLRAHGLLSRDAYERIHATSDVAFGTLALHSKGMDEACPLKVREYLAFGLPCIIGYRDTDFLESVPYVLALPNTPDGVADHVAEIRAFGERWRGRRVQRELIQAIDVTVKETTRLAFFDQVLAGRRDSDRRSLTAAPMRPARFGRNRA